VKLLLTSGGVQNPSIGDALLEMLGRPTAECTALAITTASYAGPRGMTFAWSFLSGNGRTPMVELGWKSVGVLELSVLPSVDRDVWVPAIQEADVLLVNGGDPLFLAYWMRQSGLADLLPTLEHTVWVGLSAGSMIMAPRIGEDFVRWRPPDGGDETLGLIDFAIFPHLDHPELPENTMAAAEGWAATLGCPAYAIDDDTAILVMDGKVDVISEGQWRHFPA